MSEHGIVYFLVKKEQLSWGNIFGVLVSIWIHTTTYHLTNTKKVQKVSNITTIQKKKKTSSKGISTSKCDICIFKLIWSTVKRINFRILRLTWIQKIFSRFLNKWKTSQNSGKQTKILTNKPKCRQTTQFDKKQNNWFKSPEARALLIALKKQFH